MTNPRSDSEDKIDQENIDPKFLLSPQPTQKKLSQLNSPTSILSKKLTSTNLNSPPLTTLQDFNSPSSSKFTGSEVVTPTRLRSDLRSDSKIRHLTLSIEKNSGTNSSLVTTESKLVIWGTDVVLSECKEILNKFILNFTCEPDEFNTFSISEPYYLSLLDEISLTYSPFLTVDGTHLKSYNPSIYSQMVNFPQEVIPTFDSVVNKIFEDRHPNVALEHQIQVRIMNIERTKNMRFLNPEDIDQLINVCGMVTRVSGVIPELQEAFYQCYICSNSIVTEISHGRVSEPIVCSNCNKSHTMVLVHNRSHYSDKQIVKLQESPDEMPPGQTPHHISLFVHNDLVDQVQPGDRVSVTGIYRAAPVTINPRQRTVRAVYRTYIDVIHFKKTDTSRLRSSEHEKINLSPARVDEIHELANSGEVYELLAKALGPNIYGNLDVKKGLLLQLFGASKKEFSNSGRSHFR